MFQIFSSYKIIGLWMSLCSVLPGARDYSDAWTWTYELCLRLSRKERHLSASSAGWLSNRLDGHHTIPSNGLPRSRALSSLTEAKRNLWRHRGDLGSREWKYAETWTTSVIRFPVCITEKRSVEIIAPRDWPVELNSPARLSRSV